MIFWYEYGIILHFLMISYSIQQDELGIPDFGSLVQATGDTFSMPSSLPLPQGTSQGPALAAINSLGSLPNILLNASPLAGIGGSTNPANFPTFGGNVPGGLGFGNQLQVPFYSQSKGTNIVPTEGFASGLGMNIAGLGIHSSKTATWGMLPYLGNLNKGLGLTPNAIYGGK
uniref:Uncharacterized protein n=1 Tax=Romanomermis culicivorax TaxID=13658 RepID=A0A915JS77_ROMCU